ncbi:MAG TPA: hypothetical protein VML35_08660 [Gaiellaceae bacterium]|nr:hypothetical protein [Gaiellaceae bacterium]
MPEGDEENGPDAGISSSHEVDVARLLAQLQDEIRRVGPRYGASAGASVERLSARSAADRVWPVSVDRHIGGRGGVLGALMKPVKVVVRKLTRWYVEPVFADQRAFNDALLRLVDDLQEQVDALRAELADRGGRSP